ncbi:MAG: primosomal protein N', partial [Candidatus Izemoplasmatales bacterium]|nr:primosomal protein N' [Candidatus Izemoplasmatales bacterium]
MIAEVLVDVAAKSVDRLFDYFVPETYRDIIEVGMRVSVPFGSRMVQGFCLRLKEDSALTQDLKPIERLLDIEPYLTQELIDIIFEISQETATLMIRVLEAVLPSALRVNYRTMIEMVQPEQADQGIKELFASRDVLVFDDSLKAKLQPIKRAIKAGVLRQFVEIKAKASARKRRIVSILDTKYQGKSAQQKAVLAQISTYDGPGVEFQELLGLSGVSASVVHTMIKNGILKIAYQEKYRQILMPPKRSIPPITLNYDQEEVMNTISERLDRHEVFLLHGVTASGKTEVYLNVIEKVLESGKEAIFLVPEIALTPMMIARFQNRFSQSIAILHSGLSAGEKFDEWRKIIRKEVSIAIGARSACFAPFTNLGIIIVDECHETTYKQDETPRYHAIDIVVSRAKHNGIPVILGSATPNIESYARAKRGHYHLLKLNHRALNAEMPSIEIVDMKEEFKRGHTRLLSRLLEEELQYRLDRGEQTILLMNRRGFSTFVICRNCGNVIGCPECDISLTYHEADHTLKCHYCNHKEAKPKKCPKCGSEELNFFGAGTQKIEAELYESFPEAKVVRMDHDTTRNKNAHALLLNEFEAAGDILLGTQMIAKGLDFPKVTLVGIIQADGNLYAPDFRAGEKTFQLITQVSGRAGRRQVQGKVIIQAFNPDHYAIKYSLMQDFDAFYEHEMSLRRMAKYLPFYYLVQVMFIGEMMRDLFLACREAVHLARAELSDQVVILGPSLPPVTR